MAVLSILLMDHQVYYIPSQEDFFFLLLISDDWCFIASYCIQAPCQLMKISSPGSRKPNAAETGGSLHWTRLLSYGNSLTLHFWACLHSWVKSSQIHCVKWLMKGVGSGQKKAWMYTKMALTVEHNMMIEPETETQHQPKVRWNRERTLLWKWENEKNCF